MSLNLQMARLGAQTYSTLSLRSLNMQMTYLGLQTCLAVPFQSLNNVNVVNLQI